MKTPHIVAAVVLASVFSAAQALALAFTVGDTSGKPEFDTFWKSGVEPNPAIKFYKNNFEKNIVGGDEEDSLYAVEFSTDWGALDKDDEPFLATITWISGFNFSLSEIWLKASKNAWYAFDLTGFDSTKFTSIELHHPTGRKAISHIQLMGKVRDIPTNVPDSASTLALLGLGLGALGIVARRRKA